MKKKFQETGLCVPNKHYMVDTTPQIKETIALIEEGGIFYNKSSKAIWENNEFSFIRNKTFA